MRNGYDPLGGGPVDGGPDDPLPAKRLPGPQCPWGAVGASVPAWISRWTFAISTCSSFNYAFNKMFYFFGVYQDYDENNTHNEAVKRVNVLSVVCTAILMMIDLPKLFSLYNQEKLSGGLKEILWSDSGYYRVFLLCAFYNSLVTSVFTAKKFSSNAWTFYLMTSIFTCGVFVSYLTAFIVDGLCQLGEMPKRLKELNTDVRDHLSFSTSKAISDNGAFWVFIGFPLAYRAWLWREGASLLCDEYDFSNDMNQFLYASSMATGLYFTFMTTILQKYKAKESAPSADDSSVAIDGSPSADDLSVNRGKEKSSCMMIAVTWVVIILRELTTLGANMPAKEFPLWLKIVFVPFLLLMGKIAVEPNVKWDVTIFQQAVADFIKLSRLTVCDDRPPSSLSPC